MHLDTHDEHLCARCARHRKTCCQSTDVHVTLGDVARISSHTGQEDFHEFRIPSDPAFLDSADDPNWHRFVFRDDNSRRVLKRRDNGDCTFLGPAGCTLPGDVRPLICRLYPLDYDERGLFEQPLDECPLHLLKPGQSLVEALEMNLEESRRWHRQLYAEIRGEQLDG